MSMQQIKRYRFICDGEVEQTVTTVGVTHTVADSCRETVVVEAADKWAAMRELPEGWRATGSPQIPQTVDVRCPREHVW